MKAPAWFSRSLPLLACCALSCEVDRPTSPPSTVAFDRHTAAEGPATPLTLHVVATTATDPSIDPVFGAHYVWLPQDGQSNERLLVFLGGATSMPSLYQLIEQEAARDGYHVIALAYANGVRLYRVCVDADCWLNARLEILDGIHRSSVVNVNVANSIDNRLDKLLRYLVATYPDEGWFHFLTRDGTPRWSRIAVGGHSQGGGEGALIGKLRRVARVVMFEAPPDGGGGATVVAMPWMATHVTPTSRYYGLEHDRSLFFAANRSNWDLIGLPRFGAAVQVDNQTPPYDLTHMLVTDVTPRGGFSADGLNAHRSVANDAWTPLDANGVPVLLPAWRYVFTGPEGDEEEEIAGAGDGPEGRPGSHD